MALGILALALLPSCQALPRSGPLASEITTAETEGDLEGLVANLTPELAARATRPTAAAMPQSFRAAAAIDPERLGPGDLLEIMVWESSETSLLGGAGAGAATLSAVPVDSRGQIYVPFAGGIPAQGLTIDALRARIAEALSRVTLDPQVDVRLVEPRSRTVTVQGTVGRPGSYVIDRGALTLAPMLALAGGSPLAPEQAVVTIRRDGALGAATLAELYADAAVDVALRPGDLIAATPLRARFVALGATGSQAEVPFPTRRLTLLSALAAARGLRDNDADPTGVFVFRYEDRALADAVLAGPAPEGLPVGATRPMVYRLDLTEPGALFIAQTFEMRDGDALFATNAPLTELRKFFQLFNAVLAPVDQSVSLAN